MKIDPLKLVGRRKAKYFLEKAKNAQRIGRWADAYDAYRMVLSKDDRRFGILVQMGHMSKEMGNFVQAELHYAEALELKPYDWDLHVQFGHLFNRAGDLKKAKNWYNKANSIQPTSEINELLHTIDGAHQTKDISELRQKTLDQMDSRQFKIALPNALALYEAHGILDFDVIVGHAFRELGKYVEAKGMYRRYFDRCIESNSRHLNDAFLQLINILEILDDQHEILEIFSRLKRHYFQSNIYSSFGSEQAELLQNHIGKLYGVFRR